MELSQVLEALRNADAAGDTQAASRLAAIAQQMSAGQPLAPPAAPAAEAKPAPFSLRDTGLSLFEGATGAAQGIAASFGADNPVARELGNVQKHWGTLKTPERQAEIQRRAQLEEEAAKSGSKSKEAATFLGGIAEAPVQTLFQGIGSALPAALAGLTTLVAGAPAAIAGAVAIGARLLTGAVQGAGEAKSSIYESIEQELIRDGVPRDQARQQAIAAQEYLGKNMGNIAAAAGLGAVASGTGAETSLVRPFAKKAAKEAVESSLGKFARRTGLSEALPEGAQGGQERYATNVALQREGFDTPEFQGVLGSALRDAAAGAITGAGVNVVTGGPKPPAPAQPPAPVEEPTPRSAKTVAEEFAEEPKARATPLLPAPEAEVPTEGREQVTDREFWAKGPERAETAPEPTPAPTPEPEQEVPTVGREEVTNPLMWTAGPKNAGDFAAPRPFTNQDIIDTGVKLDSSASWFANNVVGRTADEVQALVDAKPWLIKGNRPQARILRSLLAPSVPAFEEAPNVPRAETPAPKPSVEPRRSEPGLGVPSGTTDTGVVGTGDGIRTAPAPTEPVGLGLVPPKQPARKGRAAKVAQPDTLTGAPAQPATPFDDKELDRKGKEETLSLSTPEMLAKLNAAKNQPGETYTATVDVPAYFDEPARQDSRDYTVVRGEGDWTVISYKTDEGDQQVLVPPSRARALTDEQLVQERNEAEFPFNKTVSVTKRQPTTQRAKPAQPAAPVPTAAPEVVDEEEAARRQEAADMAARMEAVRKQEVEDRKRAQGEANIASEELRKARAEADKAKAEAEKAKAEAEKAKVEAKAAERAAARDEARRAAEEDLAFDTGARATKLATRKDFSLNPDDTKNIDRLIQEKKYGEANKVMDDIEKQVADKTYVSAPAKADISNILDRFAESRGYAEEAYNDGEVALIRTVRKANGERVYRAYNALTDSLTGLSFDASYRNTNGMFTDEQIVRLKDALAADEQRDRDMYAQFPEGPFTQGISNIIGNVVGGASVDPRYVKLLRDLTKAMGMGNVRIFLYHGKDIAGQPEKYNLNGPYFSAMARARPKESQKGGTRPFGPANKDFLLFINDNMSEETTIEVLTHELGHIIEHVAFQNAPFNVQQEILNEHKAWQAKVKTGSVADMVHSLRNRNLAADTLKTAPPTAMVADMKPEDVKYWTGFAEWFADNVSRWATTADKPLTVTEKFFARIAQMMRDLVAIVTGRKYPPNKKVAAFLESMGPGSSNAWFGIITPPTAGQGVSPLQGSPKIEDALAFDKTTPNGQAVLASLGITNPQQAYGTKAMYYGMANSSDVSAIDKVRTKVADSAASIDKRIMNYFNGAVRNSLGELNPMGLYRQAQDYSKMLLSFFKAGSIEKDASTGLWEVKDKGTTPPAKVLELVQQYADTSRMTLEEGMAAAGRALEAFRMQNLLQQDPQFPNHLTQGELNAGLALYNSDPIFAAMNAAMDASRKELVDHLVAVGRLSPDEGDDWKNVIGYVPFDRIEDFAKNYQKTKRTGSRAPLSVTKLPKLIGSQIRPVGNVFENYLNTMGWMVGQVMNTDARNQTLKFLESIKKAKFLGADTDGRPNIAYGYQDGGLVYWELPSEYDALAFKAETQTTGNWLRYLSEASNILRTSVTALPPFALKQVVDDIQRALLTSGVQNPLSLIGMVLTNFPKIALAEIRGVRHRIVEEAEALGLSGEYDFKAGRPGATFMEDMGYRPRGMFRTILHRLDGITRASDLAVRRAIYDQTMKESNDKLLAQTRAREFINFRRRGSSDFVGVMVKTIPFFNAYVQGMDVLYRSASGIDSGASIDRAAARKMFWSRAGIAIALSTVYAMGKDDDDEEYNEADLRTRDGNWFVGGTKLSVPGELGALFKVIPERVVEYYKRKGTPEEQEAMEAVRTALSYMFEQYVGRVTPVPQAVKPLLEAWTNYSFLTGRELIGIHQRNLDPSMQVREGTSELAIAIANFARDMVGVDKISPIIVDNVLRGYLGSTAALTVMATDGMLNPTRIDRPLHKYALLSNYMIDPVGKRRIAEFYDERDKVGKANATLNEMVARGDLAGAEAYMQKHEQVLMLNTSINATLEQLEQTRAYRKYLNSPESAAEMSMEERMEHRTEVEKMERELVGWLREAKTMIRRDAG